MMNISEIRQLFAYTEWANGLVLDASETLPSSELLRDVRISHNSILGTLVHMAGAEWLWFERWQGRSHTGAGAWSQWTVEQCGSLQQLPADVRRSITFDNGSEFAAYAALENSLELAVYFTDPHSPWQRGTNEYTNRLVRQFAPKGTNLRELSNYKIAKYERLLNDRPRKQHGYRTPSEVFREACQRAIQT